MKFNNQVREKTQKTNTGRRYETRGCITAATNVIGWNKARGPALPLHKGQCSQHGGVEQGPLSPNTEPPPRAGQAQRAGQGPPQGKKAQGKGWEGRGEIAWARTFPFGGLRDAQHSGGEGPAAPPKSAGGGRLQAAGEQRRAAGPLLPPGAELGWAEGGPAPPPRSSPPRPAPPRLAPLLPGGRGEVPRRCRLPRAPPGTRRGRARLPEDPPSGGLLGSCRVGLASGL